MKRSEMLLVLSNSVYKNIYGDSHDFETVLEDLLSAGMMPPLVEKQFEYYVNDDPDPYFGLSFENKWEPEDE